MNNVLLGILGVILLVGLSIASAVYLGPKFMKASDEAEATRYLAEGAQIEHAFTMYRTVEGKDAWAAPSAGESSSDARLGLLVNKGYLKSIPQGGLAAAGHENSWYIDDDKGVMMARIGNDTNSERICKTMRAKLGYSGEPKSCGDPTMDRSDPCCIS